MVPWGNNTSPKTNLPLASLQLTPNQALRSAIEEWQQSHLLKIPRGSLDIEEHPISSGSQVRPHHHCT